MPTLELRLDRHVVVNAAQQVRAAPRSAEQLARQRREIKLPGEDLTLAETLRVMDVAREMRDERRTAEEMFRHDEVRLQLREKLMRTARMSGDDVTEEQLDAAIEQYLANQHVYETPPASISKFFAYCWIWRARIAMAATAAAAAGAWLFFF